MTCSVVIMNKLTVWCVERKDYRTVPCHCELNGVEMKYDGNDGIKTTK